MRSTLSILDTIITKSFLNNMRSRLLVRQSESQEKFVRKLGQLDEKAILT
ncbi:MAG: hypothetical protein M1G31_12340 [Pseudanabaena sp. Salubria-1]|nr:hypothetical protein [Pseudanabaena sp. Salubria-1]